MSINAVAKVVGGAVPMAATGAATAAATPVVVPVMIVAAGCVVAVAAARYAFDTDFKFNGFGVDMSVQKSR